MTISIALGWVFGAAVLAELWRRSLAAHEEWLTLWIVIRFFAATEVGGTGFTAALCRMAGTPRVAIAERREIRINLVSLLLVLLYIFISWEMTEGGRSLKYDAIEKDGSIE